MATNPLNKDADGKINPVVIMDRRNSNAKIVWMKAQN
jgi:hypothetical protein